MISYVPWSMGTRVLRRRLVGPSLVVSVGSDQNGFRTDGRHVFGGSGPAKNATRNGRSAPRPSLARHNHVSVLVGSVGSLVRSIAPIHKNCNVLTLFLVGSLTICMCPPCRRRWRMNDPSVLTHTHAHTYFTDGRACRNDNALIFLHFSRSSSILLVVFFY